MDAADVADDESDAADDATAADVALKVLVRTGKPITEEGESMANVVLDSIADVPEWLAKQ